MNLSEYSYQADIFYQVTWLVDLDLFHCKHLWQKSLLLGDFYSNAGLVSMEFWILYLNRKCIKLAFQMLLFLCRIFRNPAFWMIDSSWAFLESTWWMAFGKFQIAWTRYLQMLGTKHAFTKSSRASEWDKWKQQGLVPIHIYYAYSLFCPSPKVFFATEFIVT